MNILKQFVRKNVTSIFLKREQDIYIFETMNENHIGQLLNGGHGISG